MNWPFTYDNSFVRELPADPSSENRARQVQQACYSLVDPSPCAKPQLIALSHDMCDVLGIDQQFAQEAEFAEVFTGNKVLDGMQPFAMCYGGYQFGSWAGQLGDGRAINLAEILDKDQQRWVLQLKGAGLTPYSRNADGLAVLRSSVREFLCSEAMYYLGVPTTRALSLCLSGDQVMRDMLYDGNPAYEPGAIVCRVAPSFIRFGNFQIFAARKDVETLRQLCEYTMRTDFPHIIDGEIDKETYIKWFQEVCDRTRLMIMHWMRVGFVHGVMNTDNMSILGLTIDYGPYGWLEDFNPDWTPNTTDAQYHRYAYGSQPDIACWNIAQFANALLPIVDDVDTLQGIIDDLKERMNSDWKSMMLSKLGILEVAGKEEQCDALLQELMQVLQITETDYCIFFRLLAQITSADNAENMFERIKEAYYTPNTINTEQLQQIHEWLESYKTCLRDLSIEDDKRAAHMNQQNPKYVLRNYLAQQAIDKATAGDYTMIHELLDCLKHPYEEQAGKEQYAQKRPDWARHKPGCSMLSCSS